MALYQDEDGNVYDDGAVEGMQVVGHYDDGTPMVVTGDVAGRAMPRPPALRRHAAMARVPVQKPAWRQPQLAPGVIAPDEGLVPLPLQGVGGSTFTSAITQIIFQGQLQKPFRGERLLVDVVRTGTSAVGRLMTQIFIGTDLQQADILPVNAQTIGAITGFGIRLTMKPAQPGVLIRLLTTLSTPLTGSDTIFASVDLLGRIVH